MAPIMRVFVLFAAILAVLATPGVSAETVKESPALRSADWANRDYGKHMRLRDGRYAMRRYPARHTKLAKRCRHTSQTARLLEVSYADVTGDGAENAIVEISTYKNMCSGRGWQRRAIVVFAAQGDTIREVGRFSPADVTAVKHKVGAIVVSRRDSDGTRWLRCTDRWRYDGKGQAFAIDKSSCEPEDR